MLDILIESFMIFLNPSTKVTNRPGISGIVPEIKALSRIP
jgi:hypothetical protein